jgi:hypothetical protein
MNQLAPHHYAELHEKSGISPEVIEARGAYTAHSPGELEALGYKGDQVRVPALVFPEHLLNGWQPTHHIKPDNPRTEAKPDGTVKPLKYDRPVGSANRLDVPPTVRDKVMDYNEPLVFTEGWKKADAAASHGIAVVALGGTWNYTTDADGGDWRVPIEDFDHIPLKKRDHPGRLTAIVYDSDAAQKRGVHDARERLYHLLMGYGPRVKLIDLPPGPNGEKVGLDDYLLTHTVEELWALAYDPVDARFAAMQRKLDEVQRELDTHRDEYKWQHNLDGVDNKALSPADKLVLRDIRRATRRAGADAYRDPVTLFYPDRVKHTGQSVSAYSRGLQELKDAGAIEMVKGKYDSGKDKTSVILRPAFDKPAELRREKERASGGAHPKNVAVCDDCGPEVGVTELKATTYGCNGCGATLRTIKQKPTEMVRDTAYPADCYPPEPENATVSFLQRSDTTADTTADSATVSNMQRMGIEGDPAPTHRYPVRCKNETVSEPPPEEPGYWEALTGVSGVDTTPALELVPDPWDRLYDRAQAATPLICSSQLGDCSQPTYCAKQGKCRWSRTDAANLTSLKQPEGGQ